MSTLADKVNEMELPAPMQGEDLATYARRVAYVGALVGEMHTLVHRQPVVVYVPPPPPPETQVVEPDPVEQAVADALDLGTTGA